MEKKNKWNEKTKNESVKKNVTTEIEKRKWKRGEETKQFSFDLRRKEKKKRKLEDIQFEQNS